MGQEQSTPIDESVPPETLERRTVDGIAKYLTPTDNEKAEVRKIVVLVIVASNFICLSLASISHPMQKAFHRSNLQFLIISSL